MPYKDKEKDRAWHRAYMRRRRAVTPAVAVTPVTPTVLHPGYVRTYCSAWQGPLTKQRQVEGFGNRKRQSGKIGGH